MPHAMRAAPTYGPSGEVLFAGQDRSLGGVLSYFEDVVYISVFVQLAGCATDKAWYTFLLVGAARRAVPACLLVASPVVQVAAVMQPAHALLVRAVCHLGPPKPLLLGLWSTLGHLLLAGLAHGQQDAGLHCQLLGMLPTPWPLAALPRLRCCLGLDLEHCCATSADPALCRLHPQRERAAALVAPAQGGRHARDR